MVDYQRVAVCLDIVHKNMMNEKEYAILLQ